MSLSQINAGILLVLVQALAAVPWVLALPRDSFRAWLRPAPGQRLAIALLGLLGAVVVGGAPLGFLFGVGGPDRQLIYGRVYGALLQVQLTADFFVIAFLLLLTLWPKGGTVARAAFREGYRQPMFWLFVGAALALMTISVFVPYFTFGEDYVMMKELGYDMVMLAAVAFGAIAASMSISEEIEGRTAVTLMSKPVSRRQFLLGKFFGIFLACLVMVGLLAFYFDVALLYKRWFDRLDPVQLSGPPEAWVAGLGVPSGTAAFLRGAILWGLHAFETLPGIVMASSLVMVLVAVAVALATRLPMVVNLVTVLVVYFLANLMPVLVQTTEPEDPSAAGPVQKMLHFVAKLFDSVLPGLELFRVRPTLVDESTLPMGQYLQHVGSVTLYGVLFTTIVLLLGLVLFEDRDLA